MIKLFLQLGRFGVIGVTAALVHLAMVVYIVQTWAISPLVANVIGFVVSFQISFWGHRHFTFVGTEVATGMAYAKLLFVQLVNLAANESLFYFFLSLHLPYTIALMLVLAILPAFTFASSKWWVFR